MTFPDLKYLVSFFYCFNNYVFLINISLNKGCDWLVTEDLQTYMLEINRSPALYYYTEVSVDVVGTVMNDLIKGKLTFSNNLVSIVCLQPQFST